jgi:tetratricopeptide (TPR) repeat protein
MTYVTSNVAQEVYEVASRNFVHYYLSYAQIHRLDFDIQSEELANFQKALSICRQKQWWAKLGQLLEATRFSLQDRGHWIEYREWLELLLQEPNLASLLLDEQTLYLTLLDDYAGLIYTQGERTTAVEIYKAIIQTSDQQRHMIKAYAHYGLGQIYFTAGQFTEAAEQWQLAATIAEESGESEFTVITNYFLNKVEGTATSPISMEIKDGKSFPKAAIWKKYVDEQFRARQYFDAQELTKAQKAYTLVCNLARQVGDEDGLAMALFHLGEIANLMNQSSLALRYYHDSEEIAQKLNNYIGLTLIYTSIGRIHVWQERYDLARPYLEESVRLERRFGDTEALADGLYMLGYARANTGNLSEGAACFQEAKELFSKAAPEQTAKVERALSRLEAVLDMSK